MFVAEWLNNIKKRARQFCNVDKGFLAHVGKVVPIVPACMSYHRNSCLISARLKY